jgi:predicted TIM-barrel fold metal-dependent hydrolase
MKIDVYAHIVPQKFLDALLRKKPSIDPFFQANMKAVRTLTDLELRFRIMDKFDDLMQVIALGGISIESVLGPQDAPELAMIANDEKAELLFKYPDRFAGAIATLPMNNLEAALRETDRTIRDLKFKGVEVTSDIGGEPLDSPKFRPLYEKMADYNLPIWIHPQKKPAEPDYPGENMSKYNACMVFGWPYQTTLAMNRLVFSGILEDYPNLKFITHHCGGMVPHFAERIAGMHDHNQVFHKGFGYDRFLRKDPIEYFRRFYGDTATWGSTQALTAGYSFFGADHILFGTDMPWDGQLGLRQTRDTIQAIERMEISLVEKVKIFEGNARSLLRLPV